MPLLTKKKKLGPVKQLPFAPENKHLSKKALVAKEAKRREVEKKTAEYKKNLLAGEDTSPDSKDEVEVLEGQLTALIDELASKQAGAKTPEEEENVKKLKKKVTGLRMKIGKAKKALK